MRDPKRIDRITEKLKKLWMLAPDWRLCQLITNLSTVREYTRNGVDLFYLEDDKIEKGLDELLKEFEVE